MNRGDLVGLPRATSAVLFIALTALGWGVGCWLGALVGTNDSEIVAAGSAGGLTTSRSVVRLLYRAVAIGVHTTAIFAICVGLAQWLGLRAMGIRTYLPAWVGFTVIGWLLGMLFDQFPVFGDAYHVGAIVAFPQWCLLRWTTRRASTWLLANLLAVPLLWLDVRSIAPNALLFLPWPMEAGIRGAATGLAFGMITALGVLCLRPIGNRYSTLLARH